MKVLSAGGGRQVAKNHGLALQEHQFSGQDALRPCSQCGQNAELQVIRPAPILWESL